MPQQFWIRKLSETKGELEGWIKLNAEEFNLFRQSPDAHGRFFIEMEDITIEVSEHQYEEWRKEFNHRDYLIRQRRQYITVPFENLYQEERLNGEFSIPDLTLDVEEIVVDRLEKETLRKSLKELDKDSLCILHALFFTEPPMTEADLAAKIGVTQQAIHQRKKKILEILKNVLVKSKKSQQRKV